MERIHHCGIAVADLDAALKVWREVLGQEPSIEDVPAQKVRAAMFPCGIELVAPADPQSPISKFLEKRGPGIHHVTVEVRDIDAELRRLKAAGVRLIHETAVRGVGGARVAFLHPSAAGGILLELKEHVGSED